ncbi:MAG: peptide chain release factor N(5)-glutamine methyltransferase [Crocinitomicaceae bacterium]
MFKDNSYRSVLNYFQDKLKNLYSEREIRIFCEWSVQSKFNLTKADLLVGEKRFSESELLWFRSVVKQLKDEKPIQYILGETVFMGETFEVNSDVLIPRPETEELIHLMLSKNLSGSLLDIGTGSGIIPIILKLRNPELQVVGLDVSKEALQVAQRNAARHDLSIKWVQSNILKDEWKELGRFHTIVSNPPYVLKREQAEMSKNVLAYEPEIALFVEDTSPFIFYERIIFLAQELLYPKGQLFFEIHEKYGNVIREILHQHQFIQVEIVKDLQGKDRMISAQKNLSYQ